MKNLFQEVMTKNSDKELQKIIANKNSYVLEAYIAAIAELQYRNLASDELIKIKDDLIEKSIEEERKRQEELKSQKLITRQEKEKAKKQTIELLIPSKRYFYTPIILYLNVSIFIIMILSGVHPFEPTVESLFQWGGNLRASTLNGQYWRLLSSVFLHGGIFHLLFNIYGLLYVGSLLEMKFGKNRFFFVYIITGILASIASILFNENVVSIGASGAIFGLYGLLVALLVSNNYKIPKESKENLLVSITLFIGYNIYYGIRSEGVDNAAHFGGLISGFIIGFIYYPSYKTPKYSKIISLGLFAFTVIITLWMPRIISNPVGEFQKAMTEFIDNENKALWMYKESISNSPEKSQHYYERLNREGIEIWDKNIKLLDSLNDLPKNLKERVELMKQYSNLRKESCLLMQSLILENNSSTQERLDEIHITIEKILNNLNDINKNNR